jgi:hypothetical protein
LACRRVFFFSLSCGKSHVPFLIQCDARVKCRGPAGDGRGRHDGRRRGRFPLGRSYHPAMWPRRRWRVAPPSRAHGAPRDPFSASAAEPALRAARRLLRAVFDSDAQRYAATGGGGGVGQAGVADGSGAEEKCGLGSSVHTAAFCCRCSSFSRRVLAWASVVRRDRLAGVMSVGLCWG